MKKTEKNEQKMDFHQIWGRLKRELRELENQLIEMELGAVSTELKGFQVVLRMMDMLEHAEYRRVYQSNKVEY